MLGEASSQVDCIIPVHEKDYESLGHSVKSLRRFSLEVRRIVVISRSDPGLTDFGVEWLDEASELWPFQISELQHCGCAPGWLLQQLLKLYAPLLVDGLTDHVLVCDADVVWLQPVEFLSSTAAFLCTFDTDSCPPIRSAVDLHRYDSFVPSMLPGLEKARPGKETAVCHHMVFQKAILKQLMSEVESSWQCPFWKAFAAAAQQLNGRASEYELYGAYARSRFASQVKMRPLPFAVVADIEAAINGMKPPGIFAVAHSHLRGLSAEELQDREGIINGNTEAENLRCMLQKQPKELREILLASGMME